MPRGPATQQFRELSARDTSSAAARVRAAKHARHLVRVPRQAEELHATGRLAVRLPDPERVRLLGERLARRPDDARPLLERAERCLDGPGVLPDAPDEAAADGWLRRVRRAFYAGGGAAGAA